MAMDIGQTEVPTLISMRQSFVIDSQKVKDGRMQVVDMNAIGLDIVAVIIGNPVTVAGFDAASGHPHGETSGVMIPTKIGRGKFSLAVVGSAEFSAPNHQGVFQHSSLL